MDVLEYAHLLQPCDILLVSKKKSLSSKILNKLFKNIYFNTECISIFLFEGLCADTTSSGIRNRSLFSYDSETATIIVLRYRDFESQQRNIIIESALMFATERHSFITSATKRSTISCMQFITQCFFDAGIILFPGKDVKDITIDDFLDCTLLDKILVNECK